MPVFMAGTSLLAVRSAYRTGASGDVGGAAVIVCHVLLSCGSPVVLNGSSSSLITTLLVAALYSTPDGNGLRPLQRSVDN
jgi:hypothetical protein